ncbi:hypothetical protein JOD43_002315 [Pullulanibacillus pueri]|uniref:Glycoside hydrolase family 38 N-terminal domain-containing protein n=1 Tax=Pullulanibacillus pueri TaxID=1437324 RepID=A0A8J2ZV37_9BACL|nr:glycoside hydrolase family 38 C-terminal domain-containing protein [Pullulanibacillus pueri]MBM7682142.1 hypothetical protein [Pullulanibacillus pueri]GGH79813.1 hypothetical protein GCM10007096_15290 [Pullulanibacillus pueri]
MSFIISHTDIGYTERQEKIERYHVDFIHQAIAILNQIHKGNKPEWSGFRWTCENMWQVENFIKQADEAAINDFKKYIKTGEIDISGSYLNMTELIDSRVLSEKTKQGVALCKTLGKDIDSAMTADINGYAWGYSDALVNNGITHLFSCIHPHHGMFPLNKKQTPFFWETPSGHKVLVWVGDHYHLGNELIISPNGGTTYTIRDELAGQVHTQQLDVSEKRIYRYVENLIEEGYSLNYLPIMVSGVITDNSPPSGRIMEFIQKWNEKHGDEIELEMSSLHDFFKVLRTDEENIPTYSGDWNDWWADGVGSTPAIVKHFREAQRKYQLSHKLDPNGALGKKEWVDQARDHLMMYAEHTWGYSSSVSEPWATLVNDLELRKAGYAIKAHEAISRNLDEVLSQKGEVSISPEREKRFKVVNPHETKVKDSALIYLEYWDYVDGEYYSGDHFDDFIEVIDEETGAILPSQSTPIARAREIEVLVELNPHEEKVIRVRRKNDHSSFTVKNYAYVGAEGVEDIIVVNDQSPIKTKDHYVETPYYKIEFDEQVGIKTILDKTDGKAIVKTHGAYSPFQGIYERTAIKTTPNEERRRMGRNRKSLSTERFTAQLTDVQVKRQGQVYSVVELSYQLEGTKAYIVELKVYHALPKISVAIKLHKESYWEPENLYVALPFTTGEEETLFVEKTGCIIRPGIDQLPYTNKEFYLLQNGLAYVSENKGMAIALKDTPLITMGDLKHHLIELCPENDVEHNRAPVYSWVMNNFWETNFKVDLSGFYQFEYTLYTSADLNHKEKAIQQCQQLNEGLIAFGT